MLLAVAGCGEAKRPVVKATRIPDKAPPPADLLPLSQEPPGALRPALPPAVVELPADNDPALLAGPGDAAPGLLPSSIAAIGSGPGGSGPAGSRPAGSAAPKDEPFERGHALYLEQKWDEAASALYDAIAHKPDDARPFAVLGLIYQNKNEFARAVANFDSALRLAPDSAAIYVWRANAEIRMRRLDKAQADLNKALSLEPKNVEALLWRGIVYLNLSDFARSIADADAALAIEPRFASAYYVRFHAHVKMGQYPQARADFAAAEKYGLDEASKQVAQKAIAEFPAP